MVAPPASSFGAAGGSGCANERIGYSRQLRTRSPTPSRGHRAPTPSRPPPAPSAVDSPCSSLPGTPRVYSSATPTARTAPWVAGAGGDCGRRSLSPLLPSLARTQQSQSPPRGGTIIHGPASNACSWVAAMNGRQRGGSNSPVVPGSPSLVVLPSSPPPFNKSCSTDIVRIGSNTVGCGIAAAVSGLPRQSGATACGGCGGGGTCSDKRPSTPGLSPSPQFIRTRSRMSMGARFPCTAPAASQQHSPPPPLALAPTTAPPAMTGSPHAATAAAIALRGASLAMHVGQPFVPRAQTGTVSQGTRTFAGTSSTLASVQACGQSWSSSQPRPCSGSLQAPSRRMTSPALARQQSASVRVPVPVVRAAPHALAARSSSPTQTQGARSLSPATTAQATTALSPLASAVAASTSSQPRIAKPMPLPFSPLLQAASAANPPPRVVVAAQSTSESWHQQQPQQKRLLQSQSQPHLQMQPWTQPESHTPRFHTQFQPHQHLQPDPQLQPQHLRQPSPQLVSQDRCQAASCQSRWGWPAMAPQCSPSTPQRQVSSSVRPTSTQQLTPLPSPLAEIFADPQTALRSSQFETVTLSRRSSSPPLVRRGDSSRSLSPATADRHLRGGSFVASRPLLQSQSLSEAPRRPAPPVPILPQQVTQRAAVSVYVPPTSTTPSIATVADRARIVMLPERSQQQQQQQQDFQQTVGPHERASGSPLRRREAADETSAASSGAALPPSVVSLAPPASAATSTASPWPPVVARLESSERMFRRDAAAVTSAANAFEATTEVPALPADPTSAAVAPIGPLAAELAEALAAYPSTMVAAVMSRLQASAAVESASERRATSPPPQRQAAEAASSHVPTLDSQLPLLSPLPQPLVETDISQAQPLDCRRSSSPPALMPATDGTVARAPSLDGGRASCPPSPVAAEAAAAATAAAAVAATTASVAAVDAATVDVEDVQLQLLRQWRRQREQATDTVAETDSPIWRLAANSSFVVPSSTVASWGSSFVNVSASSTCSTWDPPSTTAAFANGSSEPTEKVAPTTKRKVDGSAEVAGGNGDDESPGFDGSRVDDSALNGGSCGAPGGGDDSSAQLEVATVVPEAPAESASPQPLPAVERQPARLSLSGLQRQQRQRTKQKEAAAADVAPASAASESAVTNENGTVAKRTAKADGRAVDFPEFKLQRSSPEERGWTRLESRRLPGVEYWFHEATGTSQFPTP
eukprot:TRINITY_DN1732_c0_g4_i3.p1 TRINITY_DN1732_c0_g4~~TRINITY_DN1732_c0_g4_i3.p1  ORF type:complete len:1211 (-),score=202.13 TRINITY_DN1732_c0_g4_i3:36-3668(-)